MVKVLIIADDYTGALDTGVQFAEAGADTRVITDLEFDFRENTSDAEVIVVDTESRHLPAGEAYEAVRCIAAEAAAARVPLIFKKTDSALRGNVGAELTALLDAAGDQVLPFVPGFPRMKRITKNGYLYVDGKLLEESVFRRDPLEPALHSYVPDIIRMESTVRTDVIGSGQRDTLDVPGQRIAVYDCETDKDVESIADRLFTEGKTKVAAGCAGFAAVLAKLFYGQRSRETELPRSRGIFAICGSVNPITVRQVERAAENGFARFRLTPAQKLIPGYWKTPKGREEMEALLGKCRKSRLVIVDSNDTSLGQTAAWAAAHGIDRKTLSGLIPNCLGEIARQRMESPPPSVLMIMGGDTLTGFLETCGVTSVRPLLEILPGTVLSEAYASKKENPDEEKVQKKFLMVTKSGGFGDENLLIRLSELLVEKRK